MDLNLAEIILAPIVALLIPIIWNFASIPISYARELMMKKPIDVKVDLNLESTIDNRNVHDVLKRAKFKCLIIRYGTDQYIKDMANDQERYDGRLRNNVIDGKLDSDGNVTFNIPLHKRIGTQFKLFMELESEEDTKLLLEYKNYTNIYDLGRASSPFAKYRIFFLLNSYGTVKTVDGLENNMLFPI